MVMSPDARRVAYRLAVTGLLLWGVAGLAYSVLRLTFGDRPVYIHVRWAPTVDDSARQRFERRYGLALAEPKEGRTFGYALTDRSRENVRNLVLDPAVEDTHQIHRTKFRVGYFSPRLPYVTSRPWMPVGLEVLTALCFLGGLASVGLALLGIAAPTLVQGRVLAVTDAFLDPPAALHRWAAQLASWATGRIPPASAESVALFRIVFGTALLFFFLERPVVGAWAANPQTRLSAPPAALWIFTAAPWIAEWIRPWLVFWSVLFVAGAMARTAFVMLTIGALAWGVLQTTQTTFHTVCAPLLTLIFLTWSRWGDAWSVDAWLRGNRRPNGVNGVTPQEYGYTVWIPSLVVGVVFLASAYAKLRESGLAWILNGSVKYHFLSDSRDALVDWGMQVGAYPWVAVFLSFAAIAIESVAIFAICSRAYRYRLAAGCAGLSLMLGFWLFQGFFWPLWWMLLLSFLPWHLIRPAAAPAASVASQTPPPSGSWRLRLMSALVIVVVGQQIVVSVLKLDVPPLFSTYDMYSTTYGSPAEYEDKAGQAYWIVAVDDSAQVHHCRVSQTQAAVVVRAAAGAVDWPSMAPVLRYCFEPSMRLQRVSVEATRVHVDWARWRLNEPIRTSLMDPLPADALP